MLKRFRRSYYSPSIHIRKDPSVDTERDKARAVISQFLQRSNKNVDALTDDLGLWGNGLELDSLDAAELSAMLEDAFGSDPFSAGGEMPETVVDILAFYGAASSE
jgi:acyl carrier protein